MLPSTRTPEGEPLRCAICGATHNIEGSRPPGDSVCPSCGTHAWIPQLANHVEEKRNEFQSYVHELLMFGRNNSPLSQIADLLVSGLTRYLAAYGAILWVESQKKWWWQHPGLSVMAYNGDIDSSGFAKEVLQAKKGVMRIASIAGRRTLLIGVPVIRSNKVLAVIEVLQRAEGPADAQQGYLRFVMQMANIVAGSPELPR